jgi:FixJ family two-component response regulator
LVIDDESMRRALANLFQSVGLRVEVFGSARSLADLVRKAETPGINRIKP